MESSSLFQVPGFEQIKFDFEGISIHAWEGGQGLPLILAHGSGAGCQTLSNWKAVLRPLAAKYRVLAADFVGFGLSGWKSSTPYFDMTMWQRQIEAMIARFPGQKVGLVGHSFAGPIVLQIAASNSNVAGVVITGTAGRAELPNSGGPGWKFPDSADMLRTGVRRTVVDPALVDDMEIDRRMQILGREGARENFNRMFGGDKATLVRGMTMTDEDLRAISCPVTFIHGRQDASFAPEDTSLPMSKLVAGSNVLIIDRCAHSVALEHPSKFVAAVDFTLENHA
ncbi:alpha/beta fold hydrolase [Comamonas testosteroni]|uniref:alpha/beta fold hydrolase n=1 Tax=Comamonas testosteroni TaxID=285 RepID=UPI003899E7A4